MRKLRIETYKDSAGEYRWRIRATNGRILACTSESYKRLAGAAHAMNLIMVAITHGRWTWVNK
jgi:uncharacterized protein YegP (UPF0339 family)